MAHGSAASSTPQADPAALVVRPKKLADTGLATDFLLELLAKHLYHESFLDLHQLSTRLALAGPILETLIQHLRKEARIEVLGADERSVGLRYALTDRGRLLAAEALSKSGYVGPAPVPLQQYNAVVKAQTVHANRITKKRMDTAFRDVVVAEKVLDRLGPAMHSGRAILVYGRPGTGKTYISSRLPRLIGGEVFIPHAVAVGNSVVQMFDPIVHKTIDEGEILPELRLREGHDPRFVRCHRPVVISGGELTMDMLELQYDPATRLTQAPAQLKANNGMYLIDDLGRQRVAAAELLNRWIVPMEERVDYLTLETGRRFQVPFDVILIFSTNLEPGKLADEAFLRRLGYKIHFPTLNVEEYTGIWQQVCDTKLIPFEPELLQYVFDRYKKEDRPLLPCHPRDLVGLAVDQSLYEDGVARMTKDRLALAWTSYFVNQDEERRDTA